jgi:hypothetical protein
MTFAHNPLFLAKEAQQMANKADHTNALVFQKVAMVSMIVMAAAGATQIMLQVMRELRRDDHEKGRGR